LATRSEVLPFFFRPTKQTGIPSRFARRVLFHPATGFNAFLTLSRPARFPFSSYLVFHAPTVATTLPYVRIVFALFERSIMTTPLPTERDWLALGL
jgi:hypothetical protein